MHFNFSKPFFTSSLIKINLIVLVLLMAMIPYLNSLTVQEFVSDDVLIIGRNQALADLTNIPRFFISNWWRDLNINYNFLYRPLTIVSFALNFQVSQLN